MKIFLATSFSTQVDEQGNITDPIRLFREEIKTVLKTLREAGHEVLCIIEREGWRLGGQTPEEAVREDTAAIDVADVLVALLHDQPSTGAQFEIGYAVKAGKRVILAPKAGTQLRWFNQGLADAGLAEVASPDTLLQILKAGQA